MSTESAGDPPSARCRFLLTMSDINYFSISNNICSYDSGDPMSCRPAFGPPEPPYYRPITPQHYASMIKVCDGSYGWNLTGVQAAQGSENVIDCNNEAHDNTFSGDFGVGGDTGDQVITVKGGCHDLKFKGKVWSRGRNYDIFIGSWSDQSLAKSYNIDLYGLSHVDGKPLRVVFGRVDRGSITLPAGSKVLHGWSVGAWLYWWAKRVLIALGIMRRSTAPVPITVK